MYHDISCVVNKTSKDLVVQDSGASFNRNSLVIHVWACPKEKDCLSAWQSGQWAYESAADLVAAWLHLEFM